MEDLADTVSGNKKEIISAIFRYLSASKYIRSKSTTWEDIEKPIIDALQEVLPKLCGRKLEFHPAGNKNRHPDLQIVDGPLRYAIEIKSTYYKEGDRGSENDLGTMRTYAERKKSNTHQFIVFVRYTDNPEGKGYIIKDVFFDFLWRTVGRRVSEKNALIVSYRKKDGNLRPKVWRMFEDDTSHYANMRVFEQAFQQSVIYRAKSLIAEHMLVLDADDLEAVSTSIIERSKVIKSGLARPLDLTEIDEADGGVNE